MKQSKHKKPWFRAKRYGYGWRPNSWQGWTVLFIWIALFAGIIAWLNLVFENAFIAVALSILAGAFLTGVLYVISMKTGEKPRWQWGDDKDEVQ